MKKLTLILLAIVCMSVSLEDNYLYVITDKLPSEGLEAYEVEHVLNKSKATLMCTHFHEKGDTLDLKHLFKNKFKK